MKKTFFTILIITLTWNVFPVSMNDLGFLRPSKGNSAVKYFYENDRYLINGNETYSADDKLYFNGRKIADLNDFFRIIADTENIYVITRITIFRLNDDKLVSIMTFNETINDLVYEEGKFHISLKKNIMNGYKFTHVTLSESRKVSKIDTAILNLKKMEYAGDYKNDPLVYKNTNNYSSK